MTAKTFAGLEFDRSERRPDGVEWHILALRDGAIEPALATAWLTFAETSQLRVIWPGGALSISEMITWANRSDVVVFAAFIQGAKSLEFAGLGWCMQITSVGPDQNKGEMGMCFVPSIHGTGLPEDMAEAMIDYCFQKCKLLVAIGTIPTPNALAVQFARRMGFRHIGKLPFYGVWPDREGKTGPCSCEIFAVTDLEWFKRSSETIGELVAGGVI